MSIQRAARPSSGYTLIRDEVLRDTRLSYRARGVLAAILSRPDNWTTTAEKLAGEGSEGRDAIRTALAELEEAGYVERRSVQGPGGRWSTQTLVYDQPRPVAAPMPENPSPVAENPPPMPEKPTTGKPTVGFPGPIKNNHQEQPSSSSETDDQKDDPMSEAASGSDDHPRPEVKDLCEHLASWISRNGNKTPVVTKRWHRACRLLIDVDGRTPEQIRTAIDWSQRHPFWSGNILSMQKLREKYDTLRIQARQEGAASPRHLQAVPVPSYTTPPAPAREALPW